MTKATGWSVVVLLLAGGVGLTAYSLVSAPEPVLAAEQARQAKPTALPPAAASTSVIQTQETNFTGVVAELTECKRKEGVLTVKVRLRNTSSETARFHLLESREYDKFYVTADSKKYFMLKDSEGAPLAPQWGPGGGLSVSLNKGQVYLWWAKYPAPPPGVKKINLVMPIASPFEDVPISDQ